MGRYTVTVQEHDQQTGGVEVCEVDYSVLWDPEKVGLDEIARACAAERTVSYGFMPVQGGGTLPRVKCVGLTARPVALEEELASL